MTNGKTDPPPARDGSVNASETPTPPPAAKPHAGDWAVSVANGPAGADTPAQPCAAPRPQRTGKPFGKPLAKPIVKPPLAGAAASAHTAHPPEPHGAHPPPGSVKVHHKPHRKADLDKLMAPPAAGKLLPVALGLTVVLTAGALALNCHSRQKAAAQRVAQARATVTGFLDRADRLNRQAEPFRKELDRAIGELQALSAASPVSDFQTRISAAIAAVARVESEVFDAETDGEQIRQALAVLEPRPEGRGLADNVQAASDARKGRLQAFDAHCQKARAAIVAAQQQLARLGAKPN